MNIHDTLKYIFPSGIIPNCIPEHEGFFELHGVPKGVAPENCEKLASGWSRVRPGQQQRLSYLVQTPDFVLFFRTCSDGPNTGNGEFVMSCGFAPRSEPISQDLTTYALRSIASRQ